MAIEKGDWHISRQKSVVPLWLLSTCAETQQFRTFRHTISTSHDSIRHLTTTSRTSDIYARFETTYTFRPFFPFGSFLIYPPPALLNPGFVNNYTDPDTGRLFALTRTRAPRACPLAYYFDPPALDGLLQIFASRRFPLAIFEYPYTQAQTSGALSLGTLISRPQRF
jgi:hypothetical protein